MILRTVIAAAFLLAANPVVADNLNGIKLREYCSDHTASPNSIACFMYITGYVAGIEAGDGSKQAKDRLWCFPKGATVAQARLIVEKYLRENPEGLHLDASMIVGIALLQAFPCP